VFSITGQSILELVLCPTDYLLRETCSLSVTGFPKTRFKGYASIAEARRAWEHALATGSTGPIADGPRPPHLLQMDSTLTDEQVYWVVVSGMAPGVYLGK
jgi:hypothetical protein